MIEDVLQTRLTRVAVAFIFLFFLLRFLDYILLYVPVMIIGDPTRAGLWPFLFFNFLPTIIYTSLKVITIAGVLQGAMILYQGSNNVMEPQFSSILKVSILAESIFLAHIFFRLANFTFIERSYTLSDYADFNPLSLISIWPDCDPLVRELLKDSNIFKFGQLAVLVVGVRKLMDISIYQGLNVVLSTYGILFVLWELFWGFMYS